MRLAAQVLLCDRRLNIRQPLLKHFNQRRGNFVPTILLIILILILLGALPTWPHSRNWGYYPSGGIGVVVVILIVLILMQVI